jgi:predicted enzyme involved in methoxymalonyl-ACP biosynthesis
LTDEEVGRILDAGGVLYTASLTDRTGSHGEILAILIDAQGHVHALVMSCRVFQRRVEFAFFTWLTGQTGALNTLDFEATPRNEPIQQFLRDPAFTGEIAGRQTVGFDASAFAQAHAADLELFSLQTSRSALA